MGLEDWGYRWLKRYMDAPQWIKEPLGRVYGLLPDSIRSQTFTQIVLPNLKSTLIGAAVLGFALSFDETMITLLVTGTDNTLPIRLWSMMRLGFAPDINALVTIVLALTVVLCIVAVRQLLAADSDPAG